MYVELKNIYLNKIRGVLERSNSKFILETVLENERPLLDEATASYVCLADIHHLQLSDMHIPELTFNDSKTK